MNIKLVNEGDALLDRLDVAYVHIQVIDGKSYECKVVVTDLEQAGQILDQLKLDGLIGMVAHRSLWYQFCQRDLAENLGEILDMIKKRGLDNEAGRFTLEEVRDENGPRKCIRDKSTGGDLGSIKTLALGFRFCQLWVNRKVMNPEEAIGLLRQMIDEGIPTNHNGDKESEKIRQALIFFSFFGTARRAECI